MSQSEGRRRAQLQDQLRGEEDWRYLASRERLFYALAAVLLVAAVIFFAV